MEFSLEFRPRSHWSRGSNHSSRWLRLFAIFVICTQAVTVLYSTEDERLRVGNEILEDSKPEEISSLLERLEELRPTGTFIVVDTALNRLYLYEDEKLIREAVCSTGSRRTLLAGDRSWNFETPQGEFQIKTKTMFPAWKKPDWAYLEEGEPIPDDPGLRFEYGVLGQVALGFGEGYFIHGTLYTRLLGVNVTHGCIRLGDEDLEFLAKNVPVGTKLYIF